MFSEWEIISFVCTFYKDDFDKHKLETQLCSLPNIFEDKEVTDIHMVVKKFQKMSAGMRAHFSEVVILIKLLLIAPATNAFGPLDGEELPTALMKGNSCSENTQKTNLRQFFLQCWRL